MAAEFDWSHVAVEAGIALFSGVGGALLTAWRWGRNGATAEQAVKDDYNGKIATLREELRKEMASHVQRSDEGNDLLVSQFKESFDGIRRQHDEYKLDSERRFFLKDDFRDFLKEYREDQRRTDVKLDRLLETRQ